MGSETAIKQNWEVAFEEAIKKQAFNTAPVEALVRTISYYLRSRYKAEELNKLHFMEMGCGAGPNLLWLAQKGIRVSGVDISPTALSLARRILERNGLGNRVGRLIESSVTQVPFEDDSLDGVIEACVFQHLDKADRRKTFDEVKRVLKPGGVFVGYMLDVGHTVYRQKRKAEVAEDPGTLILSEGAAKIYLTSIGLCHFYTKKEILDLLKGFSVVDPCLTTYYLPREEAEKRGYPEYLQSMWTVYAVK